MCPRRRLHLRQQAVDQQEVTKMVDGEVLLEAAHLEDPMVQVHQSLHELAASIREYGVIEPVLVRREGDVYVLVAGERPNLFVGGGLKLPDTLVLGRREDECIAGRQLEDDSAEARGRDWCISGRTRVA